MNNLLAALGSDIKPTGRDKWLAKCPVHNDKDFAMSVKQRNDGSVIAHCFACGANGLDLYRALGLDLDELFGGKQRLVTYTPQHIKDQYIVDRFVQMIASNDEARGIRLSYRDKQRLKLADARVLGVEQKYPNVKIEIMG